MITYRKNWINLKSIIPIIFLFDQILMPYVRFFGISFKFSMIIMVLAPFAFMKPCDKVYYSGQVKRDRRYYIGPLIIVMVMGMIGQLFIMTYPDVTNVYDGLKYSLGFYFMAMSFILGQKYYDFDYKILLYVYFTFFFLVIGLVLYPDRIPFFARLWWRDEWAENTGYILTTSGRVTPFGDNSGLPLMVLLLFIVILNKKKYLDIKLAALLLLVISALFSSALLGSRNHFMAMMIIILALFVSGVKKRYINLFYVVSVFLVVFVIYNISYDVLVENIPSFEYSINRVQNIEMSGTDDSSIMRPLVRWQKFEDRFIESPLFGSGYSERPVYPYSRMHYHNDLFQLFVAGGLIGGIFYLVLIYRIYKYFGYLIILPFILPGLTNSFIMAISVVNVYFFMLGVIIEKSRQLKSL